MAERRFRLAPEREAESLVTAFYRFLEIHSQALDTGEKACGIKTIVEDRMHVKVVTLWDEPAAAEFVRFWDSYRSSPARSAPSRAHAAAPNP